MSTISQTARDAARREVVDQYLRDEALAGRGNQPPWKEGGRHVQDLLDASRPPALTWTSERPTKIGWYWRRFDNLDAQIVEVSLWGGTLRAESFENQIVPIDGHSPFYLWAGGSFKVINKSYDSKK